MSLRRVSSKNLPIFLFLSDLSLHLRLQELITKERDNFSKILISIVFYYSGTTSPRAFGVSGVEMKIFERTKK